MSDPVQSWLNTAGRFPLLPKSEILRLAKKRDTFEEGSPEYIKIVNKICEHNLRLVPKIVSSYVAKRSGFSMGSEVASDLLQQGYLGLRRAAEKFDGTRGFTFSTYAHSWIYQSFTRWHNSCDRTIYVPENSINELLYRRRHGKPSPSKCGRIGLEIINAAARSIDITSLDNQAGDDEDNTLLELISESNRILSRKSVSETRAILELKDLMAACQIRPKVQDVVLLYTTRGRMSIVAAKLGMTQKHCQNVYGVAVRTMREHVEQKEAARKQRIAVRMKYNQPH